MVEPGSLTADKNEDDDTETVNIDDDLKFGDEIEQNAAEPEMMATNNHQPAAKKPPRMLALGRDELYDHQE